MGETAAGGSSPPSRVSQLKRHGIRAKKASNCLHTHLTWDLGNAFDPKKSDEPSGHLSPILCNTIKHRPGSVSNVSKTLVHLESSRKIRFYFENVQHWSFLTPDPIYHVVRVCPHKEAKGQSFLRKDSPLLWRASCLPTVSVSERPFFYELIDEVDF